MSIPFTPGSFQPPVGPYQKYENFYLWVQKTLPTIYDDTLSYQELLAKVLYQLNLIGEQGNQITDDVTALSTAYGELQDWANENIGALVSYVNDYFDNLDVQQEINNKLNAMAQDGSLSALLDPIVALQIPDIVTGWLADHVDPDTGYVIDDTLTIQGAAADAKATGDAITALTTAALQNRGKISDLGYTSIAQCNKMGFYEFVTADVANLSDLPAGWSSGGYVITLKKASGAMQFVFTNRIRYVRDGFTGTWYPDVTVDTTLTKAGFAADAKAAGDAISALSTIARKCSAIYNESAYATSDKRLRVYIPKTNGYLMIDMRHYNYNVTTGDGNKGVADCWGINDAYAAGNNKTNRFQITNGGEWECAVRLTNGKDFSGGGTHGDEKNATTLIYKDGVPCAFTDFATEQEFEQLKIIQTTELYSPTEGFVDDPEGSPTASYKIADHGTEWVFSKTGICITQYIKWAGTNDLANTFMAMFPGRKKTTLEAGGTNIFDSIFTDVDYTVYSPTNGTSKAWAKAKKADIYSDVSKVHAVIKPVIYPDTLPGGNQVTETDNGASNNYYKLYWPVTSNADYTSVAYTTTDGELWKAQVLFEFEIN